MNSYRVAFNFETGRYDVLKLEDMSVLSSHDVYKDAQTEMNRLESNLHHNPQPAE